MIEWISENPWGLILAILGAAGAIFAVGKWVGALNSDRKAFKTFMDEVRRDIKELLSRTATQVAVGRSALKLTDLGQEIASEVDADAIAADMAPAVLREVQGMSLYDLQEHCLSYVEAHDLPDAVEIRVKDSACNNELTHRQVLRVIGIVLRDKVLGLRESAG